jgi:hypothetical protein
MSVAPISSNETKESTMLLEIPKRMVHTPKPATHHNLVGPARPRSGR